MPIADYQLKLVTPPPLKHHFQCKDCLIFNHNSMWGECALQSSRYATPDTWGCGDGIYVLIHSITGSTVTPEKVIQYYKEAQNA